MTVDIVHSSYFMSYCTCIEYHTFYSSFISLFDESDAFYSSFF